MGNLIDMAGQIFGRLTVISEAGPNKHRHFRWRCLCACGEEVTTTGVSLRKGEVNSCGCLQRELLSARTTVHGQNRKDNVSPEYRAWRSMLARCYNSRTIGYHRYGGRGIEVCREWRDSFSAFYDSIGAKPSPSHSLDRINNAGNYEPKNCRWATRKQQNRNTRSNRTITHKGESRVLVEWSELTGISVTTLWWRLNRGWSVGRALTTPAR